MVSYGFRRVLQGIMKPYRVLRGLIRLIKCLQSLLQGSKYVGLEIDATVAVASALESQCLCGGCSERLHPHKQYCLYVYF